MWTPIRWTVLLLTGFSAAQAEPLGTSFTYQGELQDAGAPANGTYDLQFELFDVASGGAIIGSAVLVDNAAVTDGMFSVELDFGSGPFAGDQLWLEIGVRDGASSGGFTGLLPRQKLTATPYALHAEMVAASAIGSAEVANNSLTAADIAANAVGSSEINTTQVQRRIIGSCNGGERLVSVNQDGSVNCSPTKWEVSLPAEFVETEGAVEWRVGGGGLNISGLKFSASAFGRIHMGWTLPPEYQASEDLELRISWAKNPGFNDSCVYRLRSNGVVAYRPGVARMIPTSGFSPATPGVNFSGSTALVPPPAEDFVVQQIIVDINGAQLEAGDHMTYSFFRDGANTADTCNAGAGTTDDFVILGISVRPLDS